MNPNYGQWFSGTDVLDRSRYIQVADPLNVEASILLKVETERRVGLQMLPLADLPREVAWTDAERRRFERNRANEQKERVRAAKREKQRLKEQRQLEHLRRFQASVYKTPVAPPEPPPYNPPQAVELEIGDVGVIVPRLKDGTFNFHGAWAYSLKTHARVGLDARLYTSIREALE